MSNMRVVPVNFIDDAVLTADPVMVTTLPVGNVQLTARDSFARSTSNAAQAIYGHWNGDIRKVNSLFMFDHNGHGGTIQFVAFSNNFASAVYDSGEQDIHELIALGSYEWGSAPLGFAADDQLGPESPFSFFFPADVTCDSFVILLSACQASYWDVGRLFLGKYIEAPYNPKDGMQFGWMSDTEHKRSRGGSLRTRAGERWRELTANMLYATDADRAAWRDMLGQIDARDFAVSIFPGFGGRQERDHVANMKNAAHSPFAWSNTNFNETTIKFTEV